MLWREGSTMSALDFHEALHARRGTYGRGNAMRQKAHIPHAPSAPPLSKPAAAADTAAAADPVSEISTEPVEEMTLRFGALRTDFPISWGASATITKSASNTKRAAAAAAPVTKAAPAAPAAPVAKAEPATADEACLLRWFQETHVSAKDRDDYSDAWETIEWVDGATEGVHVVQLTQARMKELGMVDVDGNTPTDEEPASLYWIQDKPTGRNTEFGYWDPVNAQWKMYPKRTVVPVEQRISPTGHGYGVGDNGALSKEHSLFTAADYGTVSKYATTALHAGLPSIMEQINHLGAGAKVSSIAGWGTGEAGEKKVMFYTPSLRHLEINSAASDELGKKYVYCWGSKTPVKPVAAHGEWNETNNCWVFPIGADGRMRNEEKGFTSCSERDRDAQIQ